MSDKMMDRIQKLLDQANGAGVSDSEREAFLARADQIMHKHKIDEIMLTIRQAELGQKQAREKLGIPIHEKIDWISSQDPLREAHCDIVVAFAQLSGVRLVFSGSQLSIFGTAPDVRYFRMLWSSAYLTFSHKMYPRWETSLTPGENIKVLAESGVKWLRMWHMALDAGQPLTFAKNGETHMLPAPPNDGGRMKRWYAQACAAAGEEKMKLSHGTERYRASFAIAFAETIENRCWKLRNERDRYTAEHSGAALVLRSEANAISDLIKSVYPYLAYGNGGRRLKGGVGVGANKGAAAGASVDFSGGGSGVHGRGPAGAISG